MGDLFERFPDLKPIKGPPPLFRINGIGTTILGQRDYDPETETYVTTLWLTLLFLPVLAFASYRVANAQEGGWYFFGRVPLSFLSRAVNLSVLLLALLAGGFFSWQAYTDTLDYKARQRLAEADGLRAQGQLAKAALVYREVAEGPTAQAATAMNSVASLLDDPQLGQQGSVTALADIYRVAWDLRGRPGAVTDLYQRGLKVVLARAQDCPDGCLALLEAIELAAPDREAFLGTKQMVLERLTASHPTDVGLLSKLAVVYEETKQRPRCLALLEAQARNLGVTEGRASWVRSMPNRESTRKPTICSSPTRSSVSRPCTRQSRSSKKPSRRPRSELCPRWRPEKPLTLPSLFTIKRTKPNRRRWFVPMSSAGSRTIRSCSASAKSWPGSRWSCRSPSTWELPSWRGLST